MNELQKGLAKSAAGIVTGLMLMIIVRSFTEDGLLPAYSVWLFGLLSIVANIATLKTLQYFGLLYTIGWLFGSLLLRDLLGPIEFGFNIVGPIVIIVFRAWFWIRSS